MFKHISHKELITNIILHNLHICKKDGLIPLSTYKKIVDFIEDFSICIRIGDAPSYDGSQTSIEDSVLTLYGVSYTNQTLEYKKDIPIKKQYINDNILSILDIKYKNKIIGKKL